MKLKELSAKQQELLGTFRDRAINFALYSGDELDVEAFHRGIDFVYSLAKIAPPLMKIHVDSPLGIQYACHFIKHAFKNIPGNQVWDQVQTQVGTHVREQVWAQVREQVHKQVWDSVWTQVREQVREQVHKQVWDQVQTQVGTHVREQVWDQVQTQVWDQVREQVWDQVREQVWDQVGEQVWDQVGTQVREQVHKQVWDQVGTQVGEQVGEQVWAQVWDQKLEFQPFAYRGVGYDANWIAFYQAFAEFDIVKHDLFDKYAAFVDSGVWDTVMFQGAAIGCRRPQKVHRDDNNRLHNDHGPAIRWRDGFEFYYLDGAHLDKHIYDQITSKCMTFSQMMAIENADVRALALKYNPEAIIASGAVLIDKSDRGNELFLIKDSELNDFLDEPEIYFLRMPCPTGRTFIEGVDPNIARKNPTADVCQAYALGITPTQYRNLAVEG